MRIAGREAVYGEYSCIWDLMVNEHVYSITRGGVMNDSKRDDELMNAYARVARLKKLEAVRPLVAGAR